MKLIKNIIKLLKANKKIVIIFNIQLFFVLFFTIFSINEYRQSVEVYNLGLNYNLKNAILYMGKVPYFVNKDGKEINNIDDITKSKKLIEKFYNDNIDYFEGVLKYSDFMSIKKEDGSQSFIKFIDKNSINIVLNNKNIDKQFIDKLNKENIPVMVNNKYKKLYKINDVIQTKSIDGLNLPLEIIGYYEENKSYNIDLNIISNINPGLSEIIIPMSKYPFNEFISLQENKYLNASNQNYTFGESAQMILYVKEEYFGDVEKKLKSYAEDNDIGYFSFIKDSIEKERVSVNMENLKFLDFTIALYAIIILSIIAIGFINANKLTKRYRIYNLNGASKCKIYTISFFYYFTQFFVPIVFYILFIEIGKSNFVRKHLSQNQIFTMIQHGNFDLDGFIFYIIMISITIISLIISYIPLIKLNKRRKDK